MRPDIEYTGSRTKKPPHTGAFSLERSGCEPSGLLLEAETREPLLEARHSAAAVDQLLGAAGPGRMRLGVDVEVQRVAVLAPGGAGGELGAVGHDDLDGMIIGVCIGLHGGAV